MDQKIPKSADNKKLKSKLSKIPPYTAVNEEKIHSMQMKKIGLNWGYPSRSRALIGLLNQKFTVVETFASLQKSSKFQFGPFQNYNFLRLFSALFVAL